MVANSISLLGAGQAGAGGAVASYDPGAYYSGATRQFWLDFSDSAKVLDGSGAVALNTVAIKTVNQESGAITAAVQATGASQPICTTGVTNGKQAATFDGTKVMAIQLTGADATSIIKNTGAVSFGAVFKLNGTATNGQMMGCFDNSFSFRRFLPFIQANQPALTGTRQDSTATSTVTATQTLSTATVHAVLWEWNVSAGTVTIYADNAATSVSGTSFDTAGLVANTTLNQPQIGNLANVDYLDAFLFTGALMGGTNATSWFAAVKSKFGITVY